MIQTTEPKTYRKVLMPFLFLALTGCGGDTAIQESAEPEALDSVTLPSSLVITLPQSSFAQSSIIQGVLAKAVEGSASSYNYKCTVFELDSENKITFSKQELPSEGVKVSYENEDSEVRFDYDPDILLGKRVINFVVEDRADEGSEIPVSIAGKAAGDSSSLDWRDNIVLVETMLEDKEHRDALKANVEQLMDQGLQSVVATDLNKAMSVLVVAMKQFKESGEVFKFDGAAYHELDVFKDLSKNASALKNNPFALAKFVEVDEKVLEKRLGRFEAKAEKWGSEFNTMMTRIADAPEMKDLLAEPAKMFTRMESSSGTGKLAFMRHVEGQFKYDENYFDAHKYVDSDVAAQVGFSAPAPGAFNFDRQYQTAQTAVLAQATPAPLTTVAATPTPTPAVVATVTYTVGGTVSGLGTGKTVVLQNNGGNTLSISNNGNFTFSTALANSAAYLVTVFTQPSGQVCTVTNGGGVIIGANVISGNVNCITVKKIFVTATTYQGNLGGISGADTKCESDTNKPSEGGTYKALIADGQGVLGSRTACTTPNCSDGIIEHINWVLAANTTYVQSDGVTIIGTTNANGIFLFNGDMIAGWSGLNGRTWTGLGTDWTSLGGVESVSCAQWQSLLFNETGRSTAFFGVTDSTAIYSGTAKACNVLRALLCVEQ